MKERTLRVSEHAPRDAVAPVRTFRSRSKRLEAGRALRDRVPRKSLAGWTRPARRRDPVELLERSNAGRHPDLVPIRIGRMLQSPFTFLRGSAAVMARDLARR